MVSQGEIQNGEIQCDVCKLADADASVSLTDRCWPVRDGAVTNFCGTCARYVGMAVDQLVDASPRLMARVYPFAVRAVS